MLVILKSERHLMITLPTISFRMKMRHKIAVCMSLVLVVLIALVTTKGHTIALLQPKGTIAQQQYDLLIFASLLSLVVVVPVFILTGFIVWRYRESNKKATYKPEWGGNLLLEFVWWGIPIILIGILAVVTWHSSHTLDPFRPITSDKKPLRIQVVALQWKWLFIYPDQGVASVNYARIPVDRPVQFELTSDAPMNSFWVPQLGGQVYAMSGMSTKLHLQASTAGTYDGSSANISGAGFADMRFVVEATSQHNVDTWVAYTKKTAAPLTLQSYSTLAQPSITYAKPVYALQDKNLYTSIIDKYMKPLPVTTTEHTNHEGMAH